MKLVGLFIFAPMALAFRAGPAARRATPRRVSPPGLAGPASRPELGAIAAGKSSPSAADGEKPAYIFNLVASLFFSTFALIALLPTLPPVPMAQQAPKTRQAERAALVRTLLDKKGIQ
ncbi:hypothetical protein AURANDRAFT_63402 [Aureococcus anophagefferens]|uniref:Uncharacterized protein n=1 Tax=Aureococcus anophagefferens TaxID=44056 RepID=F0Y733_AURAN|nr:hypothetical protein AURANDRAFT_63402 [Aureococcus anophagefferens]EGB09309.1 hypothetical protein AURANDRAFT_63402 [Aureococcus anophagefferens]|eukprot:XP_009036406.1 hypothetical protein AURANDRAFT_63402 [Aureococcus anophagefferens]